MRASCGGHVRRAPGQRDERLAEVLGHDRHGARAVERGLADQEVVEARAERVHVRAVVDVVADRLLRRDVVGAADERALLRDLVVAVERLGQAEVGHLDDPLGAQHEVRGLHVAVDHPGPLRGAQAVRDLDHGLARLLGRHRLAPPEDRVEVAAAHPLHGEVERLLASRGRAPADVVDGDDVRVAELRLRARLAQEAVDHPGLAGHVAPQHLDGHGAVQRGVPRGVDLSHAPLAEARLDHEVIERGADQAVVGRRGGGQAAVARGHRLRERRRIVPHGDRG